jgi:hypothetical protein
VRELEESLVELMKLVEVSAALLFELLIYFVQAEISRQYIAQYCNLQNIYRSNRKYKFKLPEHIKRSG